MKRSAFIRLAFSIGTISLTLSGLASADATVYKTKGESVQAATILNSCITTYVSINVTESVSRSTDAEGVETSWMDVDGNVSDYCTGSPNLGTMYHFWQSGPIPASAFTSSPLRSATLVTTIPVYMRVFSYSEGFVDREGSLSVNLAWEGTDDSIYTGRNVSRSISGGTMILTRTNGTLRTAAVSGTMQLDGVPLQYEESLASMSTSRDGTITVIKP